MTFEELEIKDLDEVIKIENEVFSDPWPYKYFKEDLENENSNYYALKDDDKIIGYVGLWFMFENCDLVNIAINKEYQGQGLGEKLLKLVIREAILKECEFMHLEVRTTNTKAYNLYKKLGFIETRTRKDYYGEGQDCLDMVKGLLGLNEEDFSD